MSLERPPSKETSPVSRHVFLSAISASALLMVVGLGATADAQSARVRNACNADARRLCPQYKLDSSELRYCMESRGRSLSHGCIRALEDEGIISRGTLARGKSDTYGNTR
jgi:hypothetical protein